MFFLMLKIELASNALSTVFLSMVLRVPIGTFLKHANQAHFLKSQNRNDGQTVFLRAIKELGQRNIGVLQVYNSS